jgi:hypothetical protein
MENKGNGVMTATQFVQKLANPSKSMDRVFVEPTRKGRWLPQSTTA